MAQSAGHVALLEFVASVLVCGGNSQSVSQCASRLATQVEGAALGGPDGARLPSRLKKTGRLLATQASIETGGGGVVALGTARHRRRRLRLQGSHRDSDDGMRDQGRALPGKCIKPARMTLVGIGCH